jgi:hypothetical protein
LAEKRNLEFSEFGLALFHYEYLSSNTLNYSADGKDDRNKLKVKLSGSGLAEWFNERQCKMY